MRYITLEGAYSKDCKIFLEQVDPGVVEMVQAVIDHPVSTGVSVRIMPDTHVGVGVVIGFTMPLTDMVDPRYIGVDIGCSVSTHRLSGRVKRERFAELDRAIRERVPTGFATRGGSRRDLSWVDSFLELVNSDLEQMNLAWKERVGSGTKGGRAVGKGRAGEKGGARGNGGSQLVDRDYIENLCRKVNIDPNLFFNSIGSLGGGNHFIELGEGEGSGAHYLSIHTGSRNFGLKVCDYHTNRMKKGSLLEGEQLYNYLVDMVIAQAYAKTNHSEILGSIVSLLPSLEVEESLHTMHNYIDWGDFIIRKGAISAHKGEMVAIPLNMRDGILLCRGKGNSDWNWSAPHGAGRVLGRRAAKRKLDMAHFKSEMSGIYSTSINRATIDEAPMAYKSGELIEKMMRESCQVVERIKPLLSIKG